MKPLPKFEDRLRVLNEHAQRVIDAAQELEAAQRSLSAARSAEVAAINGLNAAQKDFDKAQMDFREAGTLPGSDWKNGFDRSLPGVRVDG